MTSNPPPALVFKGKKLNPAQFNNQCQLRTYNQNCPQPFTAHHCVPDHCFVKTPKNKNPSGTTKKEVRIEIQTKDGNKTITKTMNEGRGLCICLPGPTKSSYDIIEIDPNTPHDMSKATLNTGKAIKARRELGKEARRLQTKKNSTTLNQNEEKTLTSLNNRRAKLTLLIKQSDKLARDLIPDKQSRENFDSLAQHGKTHHKFDSLENNLADRNKDTLGKHTATLGQLEKLAARTLSKITGCDAIMLYKQIRRYHETQKFSADTLLRADATGGRESGCSQLGKPNKASIKDLRENLSNTVTML